MTRPILIDTDPGIDDAFALMYALAVSELDLVGVTTVFGNVPVETATRNALWLLRELGRELGCADIAVAAGEGQPLSGATPEFAAEVHGEHGFGYQPKTPDAGRVADVSAVDFIYQKACEYEGALELVALGPLTNLASAVQKYEDLPQLLKSVYVMGGAFECEGNVTPFAEANIYNDPDAAALVCEKYAGLNFVSLDVTDRIPLTRADGERLAQAKPHWADYIQNMLEYYMEFYASVGKTAGANLHDPATIIAMMRPELFTFKSAAVEVIVEGEEVGRTKVALSGPPVNFTIDADVKAVQDEFLGRLLGA